MEKRVFDKFRGLIFDTCGIHLTDQKQALVSSRISKRMRALKLDDYGQYFKRVVTDDSGAELGELVNAISTNVTHFFRESRHFEFFGDWVRELAAGGQRRLRVWCAACSTGEEPYTIAMTALEAMPRPMELEIIASDISTKVLQVAEYGVYREQDVQSIPRVLLRKYFQAGVGPAARLYRVKPRLRELISFRQINLSTPPYPLQGGLDAVFCRNVMIYFNMELRQGLIRNFESLLRQRGHLFVGLSESLTGAHKGLRTVQPSVYEKQ